MNKALLLYLLSLPALLLAQQKAAIVTARTAYHTDGTFTESVQNPFLRTQTEHTYAARENELAPKVLLSRKVYRLSENLEPVQGHIYDGRDQLQATVEFLFDSFGRRTEQRFRNLRGEVYQQILFTYDAQNKPLPPKSQTYNVDSPNMKPAAIDFTNGGNVTPGQLDRSQGTEYRGNVTPLSPNGAQQGDPIRIGADGQPIGGSPAPTGQTGQEPEKKKSFWQKLGLGKKE